MKEIRRIIQLYEELKREKTPSALAVVVDVAQSSYRRIGARLLVAEDGRFAGGISGGCLEGDALKRAKIAILADQPSLHTYDTTDGEDAVIGVGLGCEGKIDVTFFPLDYGDGRNEVELLKTVVNTRQPIVLLRYLNQNYSATSDASPIQFFDPEGSQDIRYFDVELYLQRQLQDEATAALRGGRSRVRALRDKSGESFHILYEVIHPRPRLILTGYNYDIPATLAAAKLLGWETIVVAPIRKITKAITDLADRYLDYDQVGRVPVDEATVVVLMSHDYDWDRQMVAHFLPLRPVYFGMLGPRKRMVKMDASLPDLDLAGYENLYAPVGLDIGAETPEEIAASLISEIVMVFRGRNGLSLRDRKTSIHNAS